MARLSKEQKAIIRQSILDESRAFFLEDGYDKTSTAKIAKAVGIAEGTVFNYFDTKADIFLEVLSTDFQVSTETVTNYLNSDQGVSEFIYQYLIKNMERFLTIPKKLLREIFGALISLAKKKVRMIKKLAELDYKLLEELKVLIAELVEKKILVECDPSVMAEAIYSVLMFEFALYVYEENRTKEDMYLRIQEKIKFIVKPYVTS